MQLLFNCFCNKRGQIIRTLNDVDVLVCPSNLRYVVHKLLVVQWLVCLVLFSHEKQVVFCKVQAEFNEDILELDVAALRHIRFACEWKLVSYVGIPQSDLLLHDLQQVIVQLFELFAARVVDILIDVSYLHLSSRLPIHCCINRSKYLIANRNRPLTPKTVYGISKITHCH